MNKKLVYALILPATAALVLILDQITKHLVVTRLDLGQSWEITPWLAPIVRVTRSTNTGAAFGIFPQGGAIFAIIAVIVSVVIILFHRQIAGDQWLMQLALGLQLGGSVGNLVDRLRHGFAVTDFIDTTFWPFKGFAIFNIADSSIVVGVALLATLLLLEERHERKSELLAESGHND